MQYRVTSYSTICGKREIVELPDSVYGEWIVYENKVPRYHINCFREESESDKIINTILDSRKESIESIIKKISNNNGIRLTMESFPIFSTKIRSELKEMDLKSIPIEWINEIKK